MKSSLSRESGMRLIKIKPGRRRLSSILARTGRAWKQR